jgi:hypothetical protein
VTLTGASAGAVCTAAAGVGKLASVVEASSAGDRACIAALDRPPTAAVCAGALPLAACATTRLGRLPGIGDPPRSPPGIAARGDAPSAEDGSWPDVISEPRRPITKKQPNTTAAVTSSVGHKPFMLAY